MTIRLLSRRLALRASLASTLSLLTLGGCLPAPAVPPAATGLETAVSAPSARPLDAPQRYVTVPGTMAALTATASSTNGSFIASRAVDANLDTEWQSGAVWNPMLTLDRGATSGLTALKIKIKPGPLYAIEVSDNGSVWRLALANQTNTSWTIETKNFPAGTAGRFVRLKFANKGAIVMVFDAKPQVGTTASPSPTPTPRPTASSPPSPTPSATPVPPPSGPTIVVNPGKVLHRATSHILGTNRNHVSGAFPNGAAKLAKMRELTPTWGGGKYLYRLGHGPTDGRTDYSYMTGFHFEQCWNKTTTYPYDDIREGLKDANALGATQFHTINYGTSNPDEAGRFVSFLNRAGDANRAQYPYPQQNATLFELGNEIPWSIVRGHDQYAPNETVYAQRAKLFAQKMRANSDVPIKIGAVASINSNWEGNGWSGGATTVKNILTTMGNDVDFLTYHGYPSWPLVKAGDLLTIMAQNEWNKRKIEQEIKPAIRTYAPGRDVYIANTEFFSNIYNDVNRSRGMFGALYAADTITLAMNEDIRTAVEFCFDHGEMADAGFFINNDPNNTTAIFKLHAMLAKHWGSDIVESSGQLIPSQTVTGASASVVMPKLAFVAAASGNRLYVLVTHRTNDGPISATISVGFTPSTVTAYELAGPSGWDSANGTLQTIANPTLTGYSFKRASVTLFEISR